MAHIDSRISACQAGITKLEDKKRMLSQMLMKFVWCNNTKRVLQDEKAQCEMEIEIEKGKLQELKSIKKEYSDG